MNELLLGIDIGTSACKVACFDVKGGVVAQSTKSYPVYYPRKNWVEQEPEEWWHLSGDSKGVESSGDSRIAAIGLDGQGWAAIPTVKWQLSPGRRFGSIRGTTCEAL